jgi:hypothetical protein
VVSAVLEVLEDNIGITIVVALLIMAAEAAAVLIQLVETQLVPVEQVVAVQQVQLVQTLDLRELLILVVAEAVTPLVLLPLLTAVLVVQVLLPLDIQIRLALLH